MGTKSMIHVNGNENIQFLDGIATPSKDFKKPLLKFNSREGPLETIHSGRFTAVEWIQTLTEEARTSFAKSFLVKTLEAYWNKIHGYSKPLPKLFQRMHLPILSDSLNRLAEEIGNSAERISEMEAAYQLGNLYTSLLPESTRTSNGIFYTPPALTKRLLDMAESTGIKWATARVIDPACGGGAFLAPVCIRKIFALRKCNPIQIIEHIQTHVVGWEIDPFGAWLTQVFVEVALRDVIRVAGLKLKPLVRVCNSLEMKIESDEEKYELVIGNPPYGKLKLTEGIRNRFQESLYGHPNLYGLFTHLAIDLSIKKGIIALLTPTSFLSGEYFKNLRQFLRMRVSPHEIDFISVRKGVFEGVLQETMLAVYQNELMENHTLQINELTTQFGDKIKHAPIGTTILPRLYTAPWILPRSPDQAASVSAMRHMRSKLKDWGYSVSTGPLVWNRHKTQLKKLKGENYFPIVWAESVRQDGTFDLRSDKVNHQPYFSFKKGDEWLVIKKPCILLQRTTAKEQEKRLVAAALPFSLLKRGVVVENHLNMILPTNGKPVVSPEILSTFLNSQAVNQAFRAISGSVAVSAYELESLPLPDSGSLTDLAVAIKKGFDKQKIEEICFRLYLHHI
jgi:adenine-specific DNA-methyltransferase